MSTASARKSSARAEAPDNGVRCDALLALPHALHWGWRNVGDAGIEVFGNIRIAGKAVNPDITGFDSEEAAIKSLAQKMRLRMAQTLGCKPERINFINDGVCSQEPSLANTLIALSTGNEKS